MGKRMFCVIPGFSPVFLARLHRNYTEKNVWHGSPIDDVSYAKGRAELASDLAKKETSL